MASIHLAHLPCILRTSRQPLTHSWLAPVLVKGWLLQGSKNKREQAPGPRGATQTLDPPSRELMLILVRRWWLHCHSHGHVLLGLLSFLLLLLWNGQSKLSAWDSLSFLLRATPGRYPAGQTSSTFNDNNNNLHLYKVFYRGILKYTTNNN